MSGDDTALLRAVDSTPGDDAPKLVYADWLEEHGFTAWAAWIRAMVVLSHESVYPRGATCPVPPPLPRQRTPFARPARR